MARKIKLSIASRGETDSPKVDDFIAQVRTYFEILNGVEQAISGDGNYWDACTWIAMIQDENVILAGGAVEPRGTMCRSVIEAAKKGNIEILTSTFNLVEVCKSNKVTVDKIAAFFDNDYILLVNLDRAVGERGRELMNAGYSLKPPDAVHLATAAVSPDVEQFHTFDDRF
jgi:predicted nucleic acid-binding protein